MNLYIRTNAFAMKESKESSRINEVRNLIDELDNAKATLQTKKVTAGFDGFIDTIVRIIKKKKENGAVNLFKTKKEFGKYILDKGENSFSLELEERSSRIGGNMPIMANGLATLGAKVNCIGTLGYPHAHPIFNKLHPNCQLFSFAEPGYSTAYEFNDGKILLAQMGELNHLKWEQVKNILGLETIISLFQESELLCLVNWSEIAMSTDIWRGVLQEVIPKYAIASKKQIVFFDLADCSKRSEESINEVLETIKEYANYSRVALGLNKNEAMEIFKVLFGKTPKKELLDIGKKIFEKAGINTLLLHSSREANAIQSSGVHSVKSFFIEDPAISTGAGDNFNAGFCAGQLLDLPLESSLVLAHATSGSFVQSARSPQISEVVDFLRKTNQEIKK